MDKKESLKKVLQSNQEMIKKLIDDISEEESMRHDYEHCNHIRWQTGHLADCTRFTLKLLGEKSDFPDEWTKLFGWKSKLFENASIYPSMEEIRQKLYEQYDKILTVLDNIPAENLDTEVELGEDWKTSAWEGIPGLCKHEYYHAGQITIMRRVIGRDKPFG